MMLLRAQVIALGCSGVRLRSGQLLVGMLNQNVCPASRRKGRWARREISRRSRTSR
jgi:histidine ammonia-lyase